MEFIEFKGKNVDDAITEASIHFGIASDELIYEVIDKGSTGILGFINTKPAIIRAKKKDSFEDIILEFLENLFKVMGVETVVDINYNEEEKTMDINLTGPEMGVLIGKRGQTLDALQKIVQSVVNKHSEEFIRVKLDTENYRARRRDTLENLAKNIAYKVKRTKKSVVLEPMNPYERRIIHSALQNDKYVSTRSEGEEPFRRVVIYYNRAK
ncbi:MAG: protein jag [Lachnospiraceae bacterium]|nr:protein jag [Lachnospiraceae bacterium]MBP3507492.1 protein jag [Lachnospiraceae bacterium]